MKQRNDVQSPKYNAERRAAEATTSVRRVFLMYKPLLTSMIKCMDNYNYDAMNTVTTRETVITVHKGINNAGR